MLKNHNFLYFRRLSHTWSKPNGYDTGIKIYNCITKQKEPLIVRNKNLVTWYTCGPTVYDSAHIGHASCYIKLDIIQRILKDYFKLNLITVMNITDIDDKLLAKSKELKMPVKEIAVQYEREFWTDLQNLNINKPNYTMRVTENMEKIITFIEKLIKDGKAYKSIDDSIYFDTKESANYGKLQNIVEDKVNVLYKKSNMDFALWKAAKSDEIFWETNWGRGRPGWHIECSTLASHVFGNKVDIHAGGVDLKFPHHENEEVQSCAYHNVGQWVNYWLHVGHLRLRNDEKMSKSLKNTVSIGKLLETTPADAFRMACIMSHYRSSFEFSDDFMKTAGALLGNYKRFLDNCNDYINGHLKADINSDLIHKLLTDSSTRIHQAIIDDFNTPGVIQILNEIVNTTNSMIHSTSQGDSCEIAPIIAVTNLITNTLELFGINIIDNHLKAYNDSNFDDIMEILNDFRKDVRQIGISEKNQEILKLCDSVRDDVKKCGVAIKDRGKISSWSLI